MKNTTRENTTTRYIAGLLTSVLRLFYVYCRICPSVILYLLSVCPAIWLIELNKLDKRLKDKEALKLIPGIEEQTTIITTMATSTTTSKMSTLGENHNEYVGTNVTGLDNNSGNPLSGVLGNVGGVKVRNIVLPSIFRGLHFA